MSLTVHTIIKNEERWIEAALRSVVSFVDSILVFDTGSTDTTVSLVKKLQAEFPGKILLELKGECDKVRHTQLRQEMVERTKTDWFMILDGDEVWTSRGLQEIKQKIANPGNSICFIAPFYLCVGDVGHYSTRGQFTIGGKKVHATGRVFKKTAGLHWSGEYGLDALLDENNQRVTEGSRATFLTEKFWHLTHLVRSSVDTDYSSGSSRREKLVLSHFLVGRTITEPLPEVLVNKTELRVNPFVSFLRFWPYAFSRLFSGISFPHGWELAAILVFVAVYALFNAFMICGDCFFGYGITETLRHPEWRVVGDLVTESSGNFLFYKIMAWFPWFANNFNVRDFVLTTPLTLLLVFAWYTVFKQLLPNKKLVLLATFFLLFSDTKLYLHGYPIPFFILTSIGSIHWLQIFALFYFLRKRYITSFIMLAVSSYFHPASALTYLLMFGGVLVWQSYKDKNFKQVLWPTIAAFVLLLPNYFVLSKGLVATKEELVILFDISYRIKQFSSLYISEYLHKTYFYVFSALVLAAVLFRKKISNLNHEKTIVQLIILGCIGSALWLVNLYYIQNVTVFYLCFIARAFYIIKPLLIVYLVSAFGNFAARKSWLLRLLAFALVVSLITLSAYVGGAVLLIAAIVFMIESRFPSWNVREKIAFGKKELGFIVVVVLIIVAMFGYMRGNKFLKIYRLIQGENTFNFSFDFDRNYSVSKTNPEFSALVDWAKQYQGKMFLVPLDGRNDFVYFRYFTKNGIYANIDDMGQLTYTPKAFVEGYNRMTDLGFVVGQPGELDFSAYNTQPLTKLQATQADFAIFDKKSPGYVGRTEKPLFETERYFVISLR